MPATKTKPGIGGTPGGGGNNSGAAPGPGSLFRVPMYSTRRRFVSDTRNQNVPIVPDAGGQVPVPLTSLDQLDIVSGIKMYVTGLVETWTNTGGSLVVSPFFPANMFGQMTYKLQAAYNSFNQTGPLASIIQAFRPLWGSRAVGLVNPNAFAKPSVVTPPTFGVAYDLPDLAIDVPLAFRFDEYYDLAPKGQPLHRIYDAIVSPQFMAAQARNITPTVNLNPALAVNSVLNGPVARANTDTTSTYAVGTPGKMKLKRDAFWTANNPAANPPQFPWQYTRDFFTQATSGQDAVQVLIQNTGVSVGQVMALYGFIWDPNAGDFGEVVPFSSIQSFQIVTGGSLLNLDMEPAALKDKMQSMYPNLITDFPDGVFVFDFAMCEDGGYLTNESCINTYLVNGVSLNIQFKSGSVPSSDSTVYLGVEALKMATS